MSIALSPTTSIHDYPHGSHYEWEGTITLQDPLTKTRLKNAVTLFPCGHTLSMKSAQALFGSTQLRTFSRYTITLITTRGGGCPECFEHLVGYVANRALHPIQDSLNTIHDLFTLSVLHNAVILAPCGHSIKESTAERLYGSAYNLQLQGAGNCPTCLLHVITYAPNHTLRALERLRLRIHAKLTSSLPKNSSLASDFSESSSPKSHATVHPSTNTLHSISTQSLPLLPFPGLGAHLECFSPWSALDCDPTTSIKRAMTFYSHAHESFLTKAVIYGDCNGKVSAELTCRGAHTETFRRYLCDLGVLKSSECFNGTFYAARSAELNWARAFLINNHTFSNQRDLTLVKRLLQDKRWFHLG